MTGYSKSTSRLLHQLTRRVRFPPHWPSMGIDPDAPLDKIQPSPYTLQELSTPRVFIAKEDLYVGPGKWSQVYRGAFHSPSAQSDDMDKLGSSHEGLDDAVLKVYKTALFPYPATHPDVEEATPPWCMSRDESYRWTEELMSWAEVYAYSKLVPLQGTAVPRFLGAFMVKSPGFEEESLAIAMSYVKGKPIVGVCQALGSDDDPDLRWYHIGMDLLRKIHAIRQLGIISFDIRPANVLVEEHPDATDVASKYSVKIIDFAMSRPYDFPSASVAGQRRVKLLRELDILKYESLLMDICGCEIGRVYPNGYDLIGPHRRRSEFLKWVYANYSHEECVQDFWPVLEKYVDNEEYPVLIQGEEEGEEEVAVVDQRM